MSKAAPTTGTAPAAAATTVHRVCCAEEDAPENGELAATGRSRRTRLLRDWPRADPAASPGSGAERLGFIVRFERSRECRGVERLLGSAAAFPERPRSRGIYMSARVMDPPALRLARLTGREREVCDLPGERGLVNGQIAHELGTSEHTVSLTAAGSCTSSR